MPASMSGLARSLNTPVDTGARLRFLSARSTAVKFSFPTTSS